jgi:hypothetical protein
MFDETSFLMMGNFLGLLTLIGWFRGFCLIFAEEFHRDHERQQSFLFSDSATV